MGSGVASSKFKRIKNTPLPSQIKHIPTNQEHSCRFSYVINAAGPWAGDITEMAGIGSGYTDNGDYHADLVLPLPVEPRWVCVSVTSYDFKQ